MNPIRAVCHKLRMVLYVVSTSPEVYVKENTSECIAWAVIGTGSAGITPSKMCILENL